MVDTYDQKAGELLRTLREEVGLTQAELAEKIGIGQASLSKREKGVTKLAAGEREKFAEVFGMRTQEFSKRLKSLRESAGIQRFIRDFGEAVGGNRIPTQPAVGTTLHEFLSQLRSQIEANKDLHESLSECFSRRQEFNNGDVVAEERLGRNTVDRKFHADIDAVNVLVRGVLESYNKEGLTTRDILSSTANLPLASSIPIVGQAPAGVGSYLGNGIEAGTSEYDDDPTLPRSLCPHDETAFAVWVTGESMQPEFQEGDLVVCSPLLAEEGLVKEGDAVHVRLGSKYDHENCIKRIANFDDIVVLVSDNTKFPPRFISRKDIDRMAKVVKKIRTYK